MKSASGVDTGQHAEHAANCEEHERRGHETQTDDGMVDCSETLQPRPNGPDRDELPVQPERRAALRRPIDGRAHCPPFAGAAACASAAAKSSA
jgi:hypothetical protein